MFGRPSFEKQRKQDMRALQRELGELGMHADVNEDGSIIVGNIAYSSNILSQATPQDIALHAVYYADDEVSPHGPEYRLDVYDD